MDDNQNFLIIRDSSDNHSRKTLKFLYDPENDDIGKGGFGQVYKVKIEKENPNEAKIYAIKIFNKKILNEDKEKADKVLNEIKIHRSLNHVHICKYEHSFEDKNNVYILMEYCPCGTLFNFLKMRKKLEEIEIRFYMFQVLNVLKYFRMQKLIHRDLTLSNIFLFDYKTIKISDFGLSFRENEHNEKSGIICGTPGYYTPESYISKYTYKTDIFYFGMCIYYLFGGKTIFHTAQSSYDFFLNNNFDPENRIKASKEALDLLRKTVTVEGKRIRLEKIYEHPFFDKGKGLDMDEFPDYNDENYMKQIKELSNQLGIKPFEMKKKKGNIFASSNESGSRSSDSKINEKSSINNNDKNDIFGFKKRTTVRGSMFNFGGNERGIISESESNGNVKNYYNNKRKIATINLDKIIYIIQIYDEVENNCGIGYEFNNNNIGFIFNDDSQMTKINNEDKYIFYHIKDNLTKNTQNIIINIPPKKNLLKEISQKIGLLFQMEVEFKNKKIKYVKNKSIINNINEDIYVTKYKKGFNCIIFLFSNNNIQVNFCDGIIIIFHQFPKALFYFSKDNINKIILFPLKPDDNFYDIKSDNYSINSKIKRALSEINK